MNISVTFDLKVADALRKVDGDAVTGVACGATIANVLKDEVFDTLILTICG